MNLYIFTDDRNKRQADAEIRRLTISTTTDLMSEKGIITSFAINRMRKTMTILDAIIKADMRGEVYNPNL